MVDIRPETSTAKTFRMALSEPTEYLAGQHMVLRLTAPDGYTASRSYSVASAPDGSNQIELTVERLEDGEVSSFLHDEVVVGDQLEVQRPDRRVVRVAWPRVGTPGRGRFGRGPGDGHAPVGPPDREVGSRPPRRLRPYPRGSLLRLRVDRARGHPGLYPGDTGRLAPATRPDHRSRPAPLGAGNGQRRSCAARRGSQTGPPTPWAVSEYRPITSGSRGSGRPGSPSLQVRCADRSWLVIDGSVASMPPEGRQRSEDGQWITTRQAGC